jgi:hypothetical protein
VGTAGLLSTHTETDYLAIIIFFLKLGSMIGKWG